VNNTAKIFAWRRIESSRRSKSFLKADGANLRATVFPNPQPSYAELHQSTIFRLKEAQAKATKIGVCTNLFKRLCAYAQKLISYKTESPISH